ncbi:MAG: zf-HC2 domain-containing protein [bacterium]
MSGRCGKWVETITRLVDGELDADERAALETHLEDCPGCREELAARRTERTRWREMLSLTSDPADRAMIVETARGYMKGTPWWRRWLRRRSWSDLVTGVSAAAIVILVVMLFQWREAARSTWPRSSPAEYYVGERAGSDQTEIPRPF